MGSKMENLLAKYGRLAIIVYFSIFFLTLFGFWTLLTTGVDIRTWSFFSELGDVGPIGLAYAATKITQPIRIALTVICTPLIGRFIPKTIPEQKEDHNTTS